MNLCGPRHAKLWPSAKITQLTPNQPRTGQHYFYFMQTEPKQQLPGSRAIVALATVKAGHGWAPASAGQQPNEGSAARGVMSLVPSPPPQPQLARSLRERGAGGQCPTSSPSPRSDVPSHQDELPRACCLPLTIAVDTAANCILVCSCLFASDSGSHRVTKGTQPGQCHLSAGGRWWPQATGEESDRPVLQCGEGSPKSAVLHLSLFVTRE